MTTLRTLQVAAVAALALGQAWGGVSEGQLGRKLSPQMRATTARSVFATLSDMSGTPLAVEPALGGEILLINAHDVSLSELMTRLAYVLQGEWEKTEKGYLLRRPARVTVESDERDRRARAARLKKLFDAMAKELALTPDPFAHAEAALKALDEFKRKAAEAKGLNLDEPLKGAPAGRLLNELLVALGPEELASVPMFGRTTYANEPNRAERALGPRTGDLIRNYSEGEQRLALLVGDKPPESGFGKTYDKIYTAARMPGGIGKVLLSAYTYGRAMGFWLSIYTKTGEERAYSPGSTYDLGDRIYEDEARAGKGTAPRWTELSPLSAEFERAAQGNWDTYRFQVPGEKAFTVRLTERLSDVLQHPEKIDPLSLTTTDAVLAMGRARKLDVIACLSDKTGRVAHEAVDGDRLNLTRFEALLPLTGDAEVSSSGGFLLLRPVSAGSCTRYRLSRPGLGKFIRTCLAAKSVELESFCRLHFDVGDAIWADRFAKVYQQILEDSGMPSHIGRSRYSHNLYAMMGSLDRPVWDRLARGEGIRVASLGERTRTLASLYGMESDLESESGKPVPPLELVPTEAIPFGISSDSVLWMEIRDLETAMPATSGFSVGNSMSREVGGRDAESLGERLAFGNQTKPAEELLKDQRFRVGKDRRYRVKLRVAPDRICQVEIRGVLQAPKGDVGYGELSKGFRDAVEEAYRRRKGGQ